MLPDRMHSFVPNFATCVDRPPAAPFFVIFEFFAVNLILRDGGGRAEAAACGQVVRGSNWASSPSFSSSSLLQHSTDPIEMPFSGIGAPGEASPLRSRILRAGCSLRSFAWLIRDPHCDAYAIPWAARNFEGATESLHSFAHSLHAEVALRYAGCQSGLKPRPIVFHRQFDALWPVA